MSAYHSELVEWGKRHRISIGSGNVINPLRRNIFLPMNRKVLEPLGRRVIIKRRLIWRYLVGCNISFASTLYENRIQIDWTFSRLIPGSTIWQQYKKTNI